ncbi:carbohydrate ABC transporter substrate-binding protein, CUT1 family [Alkalithermobacter thermoalcaliphilus JW-YL-7 = DSM 7308]|uniref:Carbohydrate ABC transporter substrate-binding protein, CUT1 family n=1 Tax=Alkalithermobacter thermoalcaliphilus JW-YL-7 = DSM 7308 TaxID=1121328 RepID=A0A150FNW3_CLOPD|nr:family 1 extracellular solute-binding protein [[Clostridium] paradoxum JW-YL-7 = DSM 7308]SHK85786.1 carbohydrate ABC transporter substrate-binding protein, CUT1 family [[Clostridium] paradoxum JW-YL-7 = DSM 7308]
MNLKRILSMCLLGILIFVTGCSGVSDEVSKENRVTIVLGCWGSSPAETELLDKQIERFEEIYPHIKVEKQVITGDYNQAMQARIASKTEPDVYYLDVFQAPAYISGGVIEPLNDYIDMEDVKDFEEFLIEGFKKDDNIYALPKDYNSLAIFYNKDMFEQEGIDSITTWSELKEAAKSLTKDGVVGMALSADAARFIPFMIQAGGKINDGDDVVFNTQQAAEGLDFYFSILKDGYAKQPQELGVGWNGDALAQRKAAMVIEGGWMIPFMKEAGPDVNYGIAKLPRGNQEGNLAFTVGYAMSANSKYKEESAKLINFLTGKEALTMVVESGLAIPSRKSMSKLFAQKYPERSALVEGTVGAKVFQFGANTTKIIDALNKAGERLLFNQVDNAKTALEEAAKEVQ